MPANTDRARDALARRDDHTPAEDNSGQSSSVAQLVERMKPQLARALPAHMSEDRFARVVLTQVRQNPTLLECDPMSLLSATMTAAQLGLEPDARGLAYLVPHWNRKQRRRDVTFVIGYRGLIDLARRSGQLASIEAREVREADRFEFRFGLDPKLEHVPATGDRGEPTHYYGVARFRDGGHYVEVLSVDDVEKYRERSESGSGATPRGPWATDYSAMARKTVIRRMAPYLPMSVEAAQAVAVDETPGADLTGALDGVLEVPAATETPPADENADPDADAAEAEGIDATG